MPAPAAYGKFHNVFLTDAELGSLKSELPDKWAQEDIGKAAPKKGITDYSYSE